MNEQNIMNVLLYDMSKHRTADEIFINTHAIGELVDGWKQNKYVFPQDKIKFEHTKHKPYRLM